MPTRLVSTSGSAESATACSSLLSECEDGTHGSTDSRTLKFCFAHLEPCSIPLINRFGILDSLSIVTMYSGPAIFFKLKSGHHLFPDGGLTGHYAFAAKF